MKLCVETWQVRQRAAWLALLLIVSPLVLPPAQAVPSSHGEQVFPVWICTEVGLVPLEPAAPKDPHNSHHCWLCQVLCGGKAVAPDGGSFEKVSWLTRNDVVANRIVGPSPGLALTKHQHAPRAPPPNI